MKEIKGATKVFFGDRKSDGERIWITKPQWECGWYWSFGYLGNIHEHYHLSSYTNGRNINMRDALMMDYNLSVNIKHNLWEFCELARTIYTLKETAEVLGRGGSHYTNNSCKYIIMNSHEVQRINTVVLPELFTVLQKLIETGEVQ